MGIGYGEEVIIMSLILLLGPKSFGVNIDTAINDNREVRLD